MLFTRSCRSCNNTLICSVLALVFMCFWLVMSGTSTSHLPSAFPAQYSAKYKFILCIFSRAIFAKNSPNLPSFTPLCAPFSTWLLSAHLRSFVCVLFFHTMAATSAADADDGTKMVSGSSQWECESYQRREQVQLKNRRPMALSGATLSSAKIIIFYYPNYTFIHKTHLLYTVEIIQNVTETKCHSESSDDMDETSAASVALPAAFAPSTALPAASVTLPPKHVPAALPSQTPVISHSPVVRTPTSRFTVTTLAVATPVLSPSQTSSRPLSYSMIYWYSTPRLVVASGTNIPFFLYGVLFQ